MTVVVRPLVDAVGHASDDHELEPGDVRSFGRGAAGDPVDIVVSARRDVSRLVGHVTAVDDHWALLNRSGRAVVVQSIDEGGSFISVPPCHRYDIPFVLSRVVWPCPGGPLPVLEMFAMDEKSIDNDAPARAGGGESTRDASLRRGNKHFLVLLALCAPRLRGQDEHGVAPVGEVVHTLQATEHYATATTASVNSQIEYLALRFGIRRAEPAPVPRDDYKRLRIVEHALRFGLVTYDDLRLLRPAAE